jgi:hypothetical protein
MIGKEFCVEYHAIYSPEKTAYIINEIPLTLLLIKMFPISMHSLMLQLYCHVHAATISISLCCFRYCNNNVLHKVNTF